MPSFTLLAEPGQPAARITYQYAAPPEVVYRAWVNPHLIHLWWGRARYVTVVDMMQVRPGGHWRFVQKDGRSDVAAFRGIYQVVQPPERLEYTFIFEEEPDQMILERLSFTAQDGGALLTNRFEFASPAERDTYLARGMQSGALETLQRLEGILPGYAACDLPPGLGAPAYRALYAAGIWRLDQAALLSEAALGRIHGVGPKAVRILRSALADKGSSFAGH